MSNINWASTDIRWVTWRREKGVFFWGKGRLFKPISPTSLTGPDPFGHQERTCRKAACASFRVPSFRRSYECCALGFRSRFGEVVGVGLSGGWLTLVDPCLVFVRKKVAPLHFIFGCEFGMFPFFKTHFWLLKEFNCSNLKWFRCVLRFGI